MLSHLRYLVKSMMWNKQTTKYLKICSRHQIPGYFYSKHTTPPSNIEIVDININKMMTEDDELASNYNYEPVPELITSNDSNNAAIAPIDVDPWIDEEYEKGGTVDMEYVDKFREEIHYPEPPKERSGYYEFEGIKIWLPKKMLTPQTYRYRLEEAEEETLPDDIRICKFEKYKPTS